MSFKTLYKRTSTGKVQTWKIEAEDGKYRTASGQLDGKVVVSEWTQCKGKSLGKSNETSPEKQALLEAEAKYKKQLDKGYTPEKEAVDEQDFRSPMLAKVFADHEAKIEWPVFAQPKLDGMRCIVNAKGMWSRQGKPILSAPHIHKILAPLFKATPTLVFDGELYAHKFSDDFNKIISLAKKIKPTKEELRESEENLEYWIYDLQTDQPFNERQKYLQRLLGNQLQENSGVLKHLALVPTVAVFQRDVLDEHYAQWLGEGYEGMMVRLDGMPYEYKRSHQLLKRKEFQDAEYEVVSVVEGVGNRGSTAGSLELKLDDNRMFFSNIMGNREFVQKLWDSRAALPGKVVTVRYQNLTPDGIPRFPYVTAIREGY